MTLNIVRLTRLTTEYVPAEDRMRLAGETAPDQAVVIWITRRLLDRVLPHLFGWLERKGPAVPQASIATGLGELAAVVSGDDATLLTDSSARLSVSTSATTSKAEERSGVDIVGAARQSAGADDGGL